MGQFSIKIIRLPGSVPGENQQLFFPGPCVIFFAVHSALKGAPPKRDRSSLPDISPPATRWSECDLSRAYVASRQSPVGLLTMIQCTFKMQGLLRIAGSHVFCGQGLS